MEKRKWAIEPEKVKAFADKVFEAARKHKEQQKAAQESRNNKD